MRGMSEDLFTADRMDMDPSSSDALALAELMVGKIGEITTWLDGEKFSEVSVEVWDLALKQMTALVQSMLYTTVSSDDEGYYPFEVVKTLAQEYNLGAADFAKDEDSMAMRVDPVPVCQGGLLLGMLLGVLALSLTPLWGAGAACLEVGGALLLLSIALLVPRIRGRSLQWPSLTLSLPPLWMALSGWRRRSQSCLPLSLQTCSVGPV
jgi:hypothetical protein